MGGLWIYNCYGQLIKTRTIYLLQTRYLNVTKTLRSNEVDTKEAANENSGFHLLTRA